ncbi:MAG TPA: YdjY domain-containing protein [Thermoanaerobaculia bacterium]|jgi:hypothetical protein
MKARLFAAVTLAGAMVSLAAATDRPVVDRTRNEVRITARVQPGAMDRPFGVKGHHAIVWKGGRAKTWALFVADTSDRDVRQALESLGAKAGENLTPASWNERENPQSPEPDKRVAGTHIEVFVEWKGSGGPVPLAQLIDEKGHGKPLMDFRYGGNQAWQKDFKSGCIVCLYSCPGGAIGNHAHPIRDYVRDGVVYRAKRTALPRAGTRVTIILKPRMEAS